MISMEFDTSLKRTMCPACANPLSLTQEKCYATVAPWVTELSNLKRILSHYLICPNCNSGYFDLKYTEQILSALYNSYRGDNYFKTRHKWDYSYSAKLNEGLATGAAWLAWRRSNVMEVLVDAGIPEDSITCCLDIGGGEGGVIPDFSIATKYVLESNESIQFSSEISRISSFEDIARISPTLIMCCGLLEHLNSPRDFISQLVSSAPCTEWFYFEVPAGVPAIRQGLMGRKIFLKFLSSNRLIWNSFDWLSKTMLRKFSINITVLRISEHLNFFTSKGLSKLMEKCGLEVISITQFDTNLNLPDQQNLHFEAAWKVLCKIRQS